jgi:transcriptional regulator with XRE-family HTH domain
MLGNRIKQLREEKELKQEDLAKELNVAPSTIGMYERNAREPNNEITLKLANFFGVSTDYLLGKSDVRNPEKIEKEDPLGLAKIGFSMKDYNPPTETQKEQIKSLIEVIMKDNKKENK